MFFCSSSEDDCIVWQLVCGHAKLGKPALICHAASQDVIYNSTNHKTDFVSLKFHVYSPFCTIQAPIMYPWDETMMVNDTNGASTNQIYNNRLNADGRNR